MLKTSVPVDVKNSDFHCKCDIVANAISFLVQLVLGFRQQLAVGVGTAIV